MFRRIRYRFAFTITFIVGMFVLLVCSTVMVFNILGTNRSIVKQHEKTLDSLWRCNFDDKTVTYGEQTSIIIINHSTNTATYSVLDNVWLQEKTELLARTLAGVEIFEEQDSSMLMAGEDYYYYTYRVDEPSGRVCFAISDYTFLREQQKGFIAFLLGVFFAGLALAFIISLIISSEAIKPIADTFNKQRDLITNASHELKTPLTIIDASLSNIQDADENSSIKEQSKWLSSIQEQSTRMNGLICDMLELAKVERATQQEDLVPYDITEIIEGVVLSNDARCFEKEIVLNYKLQPSIKVKIIERQFDKLISILMDNAIKYTPRGGEISVSLTANKRLAILVVKNSGRGIAPEHLDKIFDRFYKVDDSRTNDGSHSFGLGLSIAKNIAQSMKGDIIAESKYGENTSFIVSLPVML